MTGRVADNQAGFLAARFFSRRRFSLASSFRNAALLRIPMMSISHSDLMPIRAERSDAGLSQCEVVIDIRQEFFCFSLSGSIGNPALAAFRVLAR